MGRPTKLTPELQAAIVAAVEMGNYAETAAAANGIEPRTFFNWMARGRQGDEPFVQFFRAVTRARAHAEQSALGVVRDAFADPKAGAENARWYLERTAPDRFGRRDRVVVENLVTQELDASLAKLEQSLPPEIYQRVLAALADGEAGSGEADPRALDDGG